MTAQAQHDADSGDPIADLIHGGAYRDATALAARELGPPLGRLCMALLGDQAEAEDVAQETLLAAHGAMQGFRGEASAKAWLFGIARKVCAKRIEKKVRQRGKLTLVYDAEAESRLPDEVAESRRAARTVRAALAEIRPSERETLVLRYHGGLSFREIGRILDIEEATARKRASRGLASMRSLLDESDHQGSTP